MEYRPPTGLLGSALALAAAAWSAGELALAGGHGSREPWFPLLLLLVWSISYLTGFLWSQRTMRNPSRWRLPFLVAGLLGAISAVSALRGALGLSYVASSMSMGILAAASTTVVYNTLEAPLWMSATLRLRGASGLLYAVMVILALKLIAPRTPSIVVAVFSAALSVLSISAMAYVRRPALPETAVAQLDVAADAFAFGAPPLMPREVASLGLLAATGIALRIHAMLETSPILGFEKALATYAVAYLAGAVLGALNPRPALAAIGGLISLALFLLAPTPWAALLAAVFYSAYSETSMTVYVLSRSPILLSNIMAALTASMTLAVALASLGRLVGAHPALPLAIMAGAALLVQYRRPRWH